MKVLYLTNIPSPYRVDFFNELGKACELTVLFERCEANNRESQWLKRENFNFNGIFLKGKNFGKDSSFSIEVIKFLKGNFDIIVVGGYSTPTGMLAINYMKLKGIPFGINADGAFKPKNENIIKKLIKDNFISGASFWLSTSKETTSFFEHYGASQKEIYNYPFTSLLQKDILTTPIDKKEKEKIKQKLDIKEKKIILAIGQFIYRKGFDVLLSAADKISEEYGIYIIGGEPTSEYLNKMGKLGNNVHINKFKSKNELKEYYSVSDLFVLPTREDIWGLVINEALAHGLPVITTDKCIAGLELIKNNENGFIIPADDSEILAGRIKEILEDESKLYSMSYKSLERIKEYTIENMALRHIEIFNKIIDMNYN